jgi:glyceraldehyde 3-phosphate dehydrogenase
MSERGRTRWTRLLAVALAVTVVTALGAPVVSANHESEHISFAYDTSPATSASAENGTTYTHEFAVRTNATDGPLVTTVYYERPSDLAYVDHNVSVGGTAIDTETQVDNVTVDGQEMDVGNGPIRITAETDPTKLPWKDLGVDIVLECTGHFTDRASAAKHLEAGAKRVLISAPAKEVDLTVVYGVNHEQLTGDHQVVSNASCTTNCLAPVAKVMHETLGIQQGFMTTVHGYTGDQRTVDTLHKDPRRARAAAVNVIPTSTGAARAVGLVLPDLKGKLDGTAVRVPVPNVSMVDLKFMAGKTADADSVNAAFRKAAAGELKGVMDVVDEPLVSSDFNHNPASSSVDLNETHVIDDKFVRVMSWYDNEWGFSNRMVDVARTMASHL